MIMGLWNLQVSLLITLHELKSNLNNSGTNVQLWRKNNKNADTQVDEGSTRVCTNWQLITKGRRARKAADNALVNLKSSPL